MLMYLCKEKTKKMNQDPTLHSVPEQIALPEGYRFVEKADINPADVISLRETVGWGNESAEKWQECIDDALEVTAVKDQSGSLIGIGFLVGNKRHAVLCDFVVKPDHQGKGIGTAILKKRMEKVEKLRIPYIYTDIAETNPLRDKYSSLGFVATGGGLFRNSKAITK
jgi:GNAT superfamily N-acetyltransferase